MPLEVEPSMIRKLDLSTFTGDVWAVDATLAIPGATVPRFTADGSVVRWVVKAMSSADADATPVVDGVTSISTRMIKIIRPRGNAGIPTALAASTGTIEGQEITESDVSPRDVFVLGVSAATVGEGSADWLWIIPTSGCTIAASGATP